MMCRKQLFLFMFELFVLPASSFVTVTSSDRTALNGFSITNFISKHGYPIDVHKNVQTEDGYLLDTHRIPHGKNGTYNSRGKKPAVFLMHGLGGSAENWVIAGPDKGLAFLLADKGYDVWIGNARGTTHSRKHVKLNPDRDADFWDFSWNEIGIYDLSANINYILGQTNQSKLIYIGHSQGTTSYFVLASERPEFNSKVKVMVALAPAVFMGIDGLALPQNDNTLYFQTIENYRKLLRINEVGPKLRQLACKNQLSTPQICDAMLLVFAVPSGLDGAQLNSSLLPTLKATFPDSAAARQYLHYLQLSISGNFQKYDFGPKENLEKYNTAKAPLYNLRRVVSPVALFAGKSDLLASPLNVKRLSKHLPNVVLDYLVPYEGFTHLDFLIANDVVKLLYNKVFSVMTGYL